VINILSVMACNNLKIFKTYGNLLHKPRAIFVINTNFWEENDASNKSSIVGCILCRRNVFTKPLPNNDKWDRNKDTQTDGSAL
jgi:hypothetical protein